MPPPDDDAARPTVIRPTAWERIGFEPEPGPLAWLWAFGSWVWRQVRLAGLHLVALAKNPMTWKVMGMAMLILLIVFILWSSITEKDRVGTAQCDSWAERYGLDVAWDRHLDMCLGAKKSVLGNGDVWLKRPFFIGPKSGKLAWIQSAKHEEPPSVSPSDEAQCYAWSTVLKTKLTWVPNIKRCIGYREYTPRQVASGTLPASSYERPYKVNTITGKRSWLAPPY